LAVFSMSKLAVFRSRWMMVGVEWCSQFIPNAVVVVAGARGNNKEGDDAEERERERAHNA
jgi:hypothetical protein